MKDIYQEITDRILAQLEKGVVPWKRPWKCFHHFNFVSKHPYQGINALLTCTSPYDSPYWVTFKQAHDLKGTIKKGEKSTPIVFWKFLQFTNDKGQPVLKANGHPKIVPFIRYSNVFNLRQTEGIKVPKAESLPAFVPLAKAQQIVDRANLCPIRTEGQQAVYNPELDYIAMPPAATFRSPEAYFHTLFHEMSHATGAASRLDRDLSGNFGSSRYAREELTAEISACFLCNHAGTLETTIFENSAGYVANWLKALGNDKSLIITAASAAQKASNFILGNKLDETQTVTTTEQPIITQGLSPSVRLIAESKFHVHESSREGISL